MKPLANKILTATLVGVFLILIYFILNSLSPGLELIRPGNSLRIMTTDMNMAMVVPADRRDESEAIFTRAEKRARLVEKYMNTYNSNSELSKLNQAKANQEVSLHPETIAVLKRSAEIHTDSRGAFDVTISPIISLWRACSRLEKRVPLQIELAMARNASRWEFIKLSDRHASKTVDTACINLSGIAKGYAIDLAAESLIADKCTGGMVEIGGDVRCFGNKPGNTPWIVAISNPFKNEKPFSSDLICTLAVYKGSVCTSGSYERPIVVEGKKYNHIYNPADGTSCEACISATVIAPDATTADAWATGMTVLGIEGFKLLQGKGIEAMLIIGDPEKYSIEMTPGFARYFHAKDEDFFK